MGKRILIVDDDPWILNMVGSVMERRGHVVQTAKDGQEGLEKALCFSPDLVITDVLMPGMNGWSFIRALRSREEMALVPVIFLTGLNSDEDRILGFRLGADDYLPKPFRFEELDLRVDKTLRQSELIRAHFRMFGGKGEEQDHVGFRGELTQFGVSAILTFLGIERKSGILILRARETGRVFMREGQPLAASFDHRKEPRNEEAIYQMLTWTGGTFEFSSLEVEMGDQIQKTIPQLLLEGAKRIDESVPV